LLLSSPPVSRSLRRFVCGIAGVVFYTSGRTNEGSASASDDPYRIPSAHREIGI
jgi:hypothetical protein